MSNKPHKSTKSTHPGSKKSPLKRFLKVVLWILIAPVALLLVFFSWTYINYLQDKNPEKTFLKPYVAALQAEVASLNQEKSDLTLKLNLINHLPISINGKNLHCKLLLDGEEIINNGSDQSFNLKGGDSTWVTIPMVILAEDYKTLLHKNELKNIDSVLYVLQISFNSNLFFSKEFKLEYKKLLPLFHFPDIQARILQIQAINLKRAKLGMVVTLKNNNLFPLRIKNVDYKFSIENHQWMSGKIPGLTVVKPKESKQFILPVNVRFFKDSRALFRYLAYRKSLNYKLDLHLTFDSKDGILSNSKLIYHTSGTVKSLKKSKSKSKQGKKPK